MPEFATFILTHGRAGNVLTYDSLRKCGYTGPIYLMVDNKDKQLEAYRKEFGDQVVVFDKQAAVDATDACDNYMRHNSVVFARNWNFRVAKELGIKYFWQLDDDYTEFRWSINNARQYITSNVRTARLDEIIPPCVQFMKDTQAKSLAFAQAGDFIGGANGTVAKLGIRGSFSRKVMNTFFFRTDRPVTFRGRVNDDVNLYVECGRRGDLFVTVPRLRIQQPETQTRAGGCTEIYKEFGTYIKSFYSVLVAPSCVKIGMFHGKSHSRIHHNVRWANTCPVIIDEKYRKPRAA